jgi:hypothetical protein
MDIPPEFASLRNNTQTLKDPQSSAALARMAIKNRASEIACRFKAAESACGLELWVGTAQFFAIHYVRLWIDGSIIEALVDSKEAMTRCYTPSPAGIQLKWTGAPEALKSLTVSGVTPVSGDRLTT